MIDCKRVTSFPVLWRVFSSSVPILGRNRLQTGAGSMRILRLGRGVGKTSNGGGTLGGSHYFSLFISSHGVRSQRQVKGKSRAEDRSVRPTKQKRRLYSGKLSSFFSSRAIRMTR